MQRSVSSANTRVVDYNVASGRLLIPKDLCQFASIKKQVVLSSAINIIEIWDKDSYEQTIDDAAMDFASLAEEVMGNSDEDGIS